jgi:hypothetical protein
LVDYLSGVRSVSISAYYRHFGSIAADYSGNREKALDNSGRPGQCPFSSNSITPRSAPQ